MVLRRSNMRKRMSAFGQKQALSDISAMSAYPQKQTSLSAIAMSALCQKLTCRLLPP